MKKFFAIIGLAGLILAIVIIYFSYGKNTANNKQQTGQPDQKTVLEDSSQQEATPEANPAADKEPDYKASISISSYGFSPSNLTVREGDVLQLSIVSVDSSKHSFGFPKRIVGASQVEVEAGKTKVMKFFVPAAGEYVFGCLEPGHEKETGKMTVVSRNPVVSETNSQATQTYNLMLSVSSQGYYPKEFTVNALQ